MFLMMSDPLMTDWADVNAKNKNLYLYGRSEDWVYKAIDIVESKIHGIIDRDSSFHDQELHGIPIIAPEQLVHVENPFFVITAGEYHSVVQDLERMRYKPGEDFVCSPDLNDWIRLKKINDIEYDILISCSDYDDMSRARSSKKGGGLYSYNNVSNELNLLVKGSFRQITELPDNRLAAIEFVNHELIIFNRDGYDIIWTRDLEKPNYCGLCYNQNRGILHLVNAGDDTIADFKLESREVSRVRDLKSHNHTSKHHYNDCAVYNDSLFLSYFSHSGNYHLNSLDGGVARLDYDENRPTSSVISGLSKPHSPFIKSGNLYVLDSLTGKILNSRREIIGHFPGFIRGIDYQGNLLFIGQSQDMYLSERQSNYSSVLNSGIYVYDLSTNASIFNSIDGIMNIHDVLLISAKYVP